MKTKDWEKKGKCYIKIVEERLQCVQILKSEANVKLNEMLRAQKFLYRNYMYIKVYMHTYVCVYLYTFAQSM